jgi:hypothetical protein
MVVRTKARRKVKGLVDAAIGEAKLLEAEERNAAKAAWTARQNAKQAVRDSTCIRAFTLPVACPAELQWADVRGPLSLAFREARELSNWLVRTLAALDSAPPVVREDGKRLMPPKPQLPTTPTLYMQGRAVAPSLNTGTVAQITQDVIGAYMKHRFDVFLGKRSLNVYRGGVLPFRAQEALRAPLVVSGGGSLELGLPFMQPDADGHFKPVWIRWSLKSGGARYGRAAQALRAIATGKSDGEIRSVYLIEAPNGPGGRSAEVMCKVVVRYPIKGRDVEASGSMAVCTHPEALLKFWRLASPGRAADSQPRWLRYDHLRRLLAQRRDLAQRLAEDLRVESRMPREKRDRLHAGNKVRLDKLSRAIGDALKCAAREVVETARRRRCSELIYRDLRHSQAAPGAECDGVIKPDDGYAPGLAWHMLRDRIKVLCHEGSIQFTYDEEAKLVPAELPILNNEIAERLINSQQEVE